MRGTPTPGGGHRGEPVLWTTGGAGTHTGHARDTRAHKGTRITQTNLTTIQTQRHTRTTTRPAQHPQARSRPLPAADSEEAAPSEPDPAFTRSQSASPRLLEGGRRNEGARGRCVTAGGAARAQTGRQTDRAPNELETRETEAGMRNGRGEANLRAQRRDHEGPRVEHGAGAKRAPLTLG